MITFLIFLFARPNICSSQTESVGSIGLSIIAGNIGYMKL